MRAVALPGTDIASSALGMGCASLGSRYSARDGIRALEAAFNCGVTWFDVAPAYGAGEAEAILGRFLQGKRDSVQLCTKVGLAPPAQGLAKRLLMPVARPIVAKLKGLRGAVRQSGTTANTRLPLTAELIEQSITSSLTWLGTDHVDVYALHDPVPEDVLRDEVLRALERVISRGQTRVVAVAGELNAVLAAAASETYAILQTADSPLDDPLEQIRHATSRPIATVSHSIFGASGARTHLAKLLVEHPQLLAEARAAGFGDDPGNAAAKLLMARAFSANPDGVVLASMFGASHLEANLRSAAMSCEMAEIAKSLVRRCMAGPRPTY